MLSAMLRSALQVLEGQRARAGSTTRRAALPGALAALAALALASSAHAVGAPVNVGTPFDITALSSAVDPAGTDYVAWANDKDLPPRTTDVVEYCALPVGASSCAHSGVLTPADGAGHIDGVQVLADGSTLIVLADVYGAQGAHATDYEPEQEWQSTDGGATFTLVNGGLSVASGVIDADTEPLGAVILPGTGVLGYGWDTAGSSPPSFNAFPLSGPPECSEATCPAGFATLEPNTNPDQIGNAGGAFAAQQGAEPGVLGIFNTVFTNGPLGCAETFGVAYVYGSGNQSASNNYNISPGQPNTAWQVPVTQADCDVEYPAVAGGPSGFGIVEDNLATHTTIYHRFDQATDKFDIPPVTIAPEFEEQPAVSQDGIGGVYTTYIAGAGGPVRLGYSADGGRSWAVGTLDADADEGVANLTSSVNGAGQGWATWFDNGSIYARSFTAADSIMPPVAGPAPVAPAPPLAPDSEYKVQSVVVNADGTVTITFVPTQSGEATLVLTVPTASIASASAREAKAKKCKHGQIRLKGKCRPASSVAGRTTAKGTAGVPLKLAVKLSGKVRAQLKHGKTVHLTATLSYVSALGGKATVKTFGVIARGHRSKHRH